MAITPNSVQPVRVYADDDARLPRKLRDVLQRHYDSRSEAILNGTPKTIEAYREAVGYLQGLKKSIQECEEADKDIAGR